MINNNFQNLLNKDVSQGYFPLLYNYSYYYQANKYILNASNGNTRAICEICPKLTIKPPERCGSLYYLRTYFTPFSSIAIVDLEHVFVAGYFASL